MPPANATCTAHTSAVFIMICLPASWAMKGPAMQIFGRRLGYVHIFWVFKPVCLHTWHLCHLSFYTDQSNSSWSIKATGSGQFKDVQHLKKKWSCKMTIGLGLRRDLELDSEETCLAYGGCLSHSFGANEEKCSVPSEFPSRFGTSLGAAGQLTGETGWVCRGAQAQRGI